MVSEALALRASAARELLNKFLGRGLKSGDRPLSQREISRLTGIPRSTLGDFMAGRTKPRLSSVERIERTILDPRLVLMQERDRTVVVDAPLFTRETLSAMPRPQNPRGFAFLYYIEGYGYGTTATTAVESGGPEDFIDLVGDDPESIQRVIWYMR